MAKLDRELTEKMFNCQTADDVKVIVESGADLTTASRMAIDEVLTRVYNKRCTGIKEAAIKMLVGAVNGEDIPDEPITHSFNQPKPVMPQIPAMDPAERATRIRERVEQMVEEKSDHFIRVGSLRRDAELKMLGASDEDYKVLFVDSTKVVCGMDSSGKVYVMHRDQATMDELSSKYGDTYFK